MSWDEDADGGMATEDDPDDDDDGMGCRVCGTESDELRAGMCPECVDELEGLTDDSLDDMTT